ncbi:hypothetical protein HXP45_02655 [Streptomyces actuosus]|uniref:Large membrane protein n=1 Tax=Streptomyces griseosporeus TaxID=1910 RepID=A0ABV3KZN3_STRGS|nr:hypothetical protein [Streptomyces actuosus]
MNTERPDNDDAAADTTESAAGKDAAREAPGARPEEPASGARAEDSASGTRPDDSASGTPDEDSGTHADDSGTRAGDSGTRSARRRSPVVVASVVAAVLLVGGGGAYLTASASGGSGGGTGSGAPGGDGSPAPLVLDGYSEGSGGTGGPGGTGGTNGIAPGEPNPYGVAYQAAGPLPDGPGSASVYWAKGEVGRDEVARLAQALGIDGAPVAEGQTWRVGQGKDGQGPMLQVNRKAPGAWTFSRYAPGGDNCVSGKPVCPQTSGPGSASADPVSPDAAKKAAAPVLKAVGQDGAKVDASQLMGSRRVVNAEPEVGGLPTYGWTTGVIVSPQGEVVGGSGQLKAPVKGDTYPVVGAEEALAALNAGPGAEQQHRMGIGGCASPVPLKDRLEQPCGDSPAPAPARQTLKVEDATFGLAMRYANGGQALVPSWLFEVRAPEAKEPFTVTYPAVEPKYLSAPPAGTPTEQPSPRPTGPGDEPTAAPAPRDVPVDGYTAEGRELTVAFTGGVCADYEVTAEENADRVTVTVTGTPWPGKVCIEIAKVFHKTVRLDEPLGGRKVVGKDGRGVPLEKPGARLPAESGQPR